MSAGVLAGKLAISGGKDSTLCMFILRELGYDVRPAIVDMGYETFPAAAIQEAAKANGFEPNVISAREGGTVDALARSDREKLRSYLHILENLGDQTPCGHCSQSKRLLLAKHATSLGTNQVVLGHHRTDMVATLLKDYFLICYQNSYQEYERERFRTFLSTARIDPDEVRNMVHAKKASGMAIRVRLIPGCHQPER